MASDVLKLTDRKLLPPEDFCLVVPSDFQAPRISNALGHGHGHGHRLTKPWSWWSGNLPNIEFLVRSDKGVTNPGGLVPTWSDQSTNDRDCTQGTDAKKFTQVRGGGVNNLPYMLLDGARAMVIGGSPFTITDMVVWVVLRATSNPGAGTSQNPLSLKSATPKFAELARINVGGYQPQQFGTNVGGVPSVEDGIADVLDTAIHTNVITVTADVLTSWIVDGASKAIVAGGSFGRVLTDVSSVGGRVNSVGGIIAGFVGELYEIGVAGPQTAANRTLLVDYLARRYL